jgi:L-ascorbate metabolism protein UlaG (beta-lactamase superfamily)
MAMEIQYFGQSCFRLKGKQGVLVTDPFDPQYVGLKLPKLAADVVTISHDHSDHNYLSGVQQGVNRPHPFVISGPGEYEVSGIFINGIGSFHDETEGSQRGKNTIYLIKQDNLRLVHLGDLGHKLTEEQLEKINSPEVLFLPVGGIYTIDGETAAQVVAQIEPKVVIPMHYRLPGLIIELDELEKFLKTMGVEDLKPQPKLTLNYQTLPEEREVVVLSARS